MAEDIKSKVQEAAARLDDCREAHARALAGALDSPGDPEAERLKRLAVKDGREALKDHRDAVGEALVGE